jgi:hypothetical protein
LLIDTIAVLVILFTPALSHMLSFPLYYAEPMRIMLIIAIAHTRKENAWFLALVLPFISYFVSGHPLLPKAILISGELLINVFLFYQLWKLSKKVFPALLMSIILSKGIYYAAKYFLLQEAILQGNFIGTPIVIQAISTLAFSAYIYLVFRHQSSNT